MNQGILAALRGDQDQRGGSFDILDTSPKATLDSQAEWSGGLIGFKHKPSLKIFKKTGVARAN